MNYKKVVDDYVESILSGKKIANKWVKLACQRYVDDLKRDDLEFRTNEPDTAIELIQAQMVHSKGEDLDGNPLFGKPFLLTPFQMFIIYNLLGFYYKGTNNRRFKEAFIELARKNGKTSFIGALAWALSIMSRKSGATLYIASASSKQALQGFNFILNSIDYRGWRDQFKINDSYVKHSIERKFRNKDGKAVGSMCIEALASNPDAHDSYNCNLAIIDELHALGDEREYKRFKEAMKSYQNKLIVGISTAGDKANCFCHDQENYCQKVLEGIVKDDSIFAFIAKADEDVKGNVDFLNPVEHEKANPNIGVSVRAEDLMTEALQAQNDPRSRFSFYTRSLNVWLSSTKTYFDIQEFRNSDRNYKWTLEELVKMNLDWYGGADLSKLHDLTASCLYAHHPELDVDIIIPHAFFPITSAYEKAEKDRIPLFGWQDDGWLTMSNSATVNHSEIVQWFIDMRAKGFNIVQVGHDRKFCREYFFGMKHAGFNIVDQPQYHWRKSEGFRHIEVQAKNEKLYYLHSDAYEYCVSNVTAIEKLDDMVEFKKVSETSRIDIFDASVFACCRYLECMELQQDMKKWFGL